MSEKSRDQVWNVFAEALQTFDVKNADYGDAWRKSGWRGNLPRIFEKVERVRELLWRPDPRTPAVNDESAVNTLVDLMNSIAFAVVNLREEVEYGSEVPRSERTAWNPSVDSIMSREAPTTVVPNHLLSETFSPAHVTPLDEPEKISVAKRPIVDNPQA